MINPWHLRCLIYLQIILEILGECCGFHTFWPLRMEDLKDDQFVYLQQLFVWEFLLVSSSWFWAYQSCICARVIIRYLAFHRQSVSHLLLLIRFELVNVPFSLCFVVFKLQKFDCNDMITYLPCSGIWSGPKVTILFILY